MYVEFLGLGLRLWWVFFSFSRSWYSDVGRVDGAFGSFALLCFLPRCCLWFGGLGVWELWGFGFLAIVWYGKVWYGFYSI